MRSNTMDGHMMDGLGTAIVVLCILAAVAGGAVVGIAWWLL